jgi:WS/DGAT/MGAT family acyltransferase
VHRLNGLEAFFLLHENATNSSNTGCLMRLQPDDPAHPITLDALRAHLAARLDMTPVLRLHLRHMPLRLHHPILVDDPDFQLDRHVGELPLEAPADEAALYRAWARRTTQRFDPAHSPWHMDLVNVSDGTQAIFFIFHHVLMDGVAYVATLDAICTDDPVPPPFTRPFAPEHWSKGRLVKDAVRDLARLGRGLPRLFSETRRGRRAMAARIAETSKEVPPPAPMLGPLRPGYTPSLDRALATVDLSFADVRAVRKAADVTINTVLLAVVSISMRRYLLRRGLLPEQPLTVGVMASLEPVNPPPRTNGNLFANFLVPVATDLDDPWAQMLFISKAAAEGKLRLEHLGIDMENRWLQMIPPFVGIPLTRYQMRHADPAHQGRAAFTFSNVRGASTYHFLGSAMKGLYTYGPIGDTPGTFIASTNLGDAVHLVVNTNPSSLEDPAELAASFKGTLAELVTLAKQHAGSAA